MAISDGSTRVTFDVPDEALADVDAEAQKIDRPRAYMLRLIIAKWRDSLPSPPQEVQSAEVP